MPKRVWILTTLFLVATAFFVPFLTLNVFAAAPDVVTNVVPTTANLAVTLTWTNPASVDFTGTMVRYSTTAFPTSTSDGTLVEDVAGAVSGTSTTTLSSLTAGTIYYFSLFSHNVTPEYSAAVNTQQLVMPARFTEDFESRSLADLNGQNGWVVLGGTWTVIDTAGEQTVQTSSTNVAFQTNRVLNGGTVPTYTDQMIRADWKGSSALTPGQVFLRAQSASADSGGYFMFQTGGTIYLYYKTTSGGTSVSMASASFTPVAGTWYTYEFSVVNNSAGLPVLKGYVWDRSSAKPSTPTLQATDTFNRFPQGVFSIGKTNIAVTEYDNIVFSGMIGVSQANVTPGNLQNVINWTNPTFATYSGTMVRASTSTFPTSITDGTLVSNVGGSSAGTSSATHTGLTNGTTYYYTLFPYDSGGDYGTPMHLKQIAFPALFSDNFNDLTLGTIVGQNGWTSTAGTWEVADISSERVLNGSATTTYPTNKVINGGASTTDQILSTRFKSDNGNNTAGYIWLRYQTDGSGYLIWHNGNAWKISYMSGTLTTLATSDVTAASPMEANVWFNQEVSIVNNDSELPVINVYIWRDGAEKPTTPTLTATDSSDRFVQGSFALGRNATNATYYDNVGFYGSGPPLDITSPAAGVVGAPDVATISIADTNGTIYVPFIQTSTTLSVAASAGAVPSGGGVEFVLNEGLGSEQSVIDLTTSYGTTFVGLAKGEYTLDAYVIDADGVTRLLDESSHDERTSIGIGDIITVIGDSIVAGYSGTTDAGVVSNWLDADPGTASADNRNFPQYNSGTALYSESYLTDLNDKLSAYYGYPIFLMNEGHGGTRADGYLTSDMAAAEWQTRQNTLVPNKWIVALGNNDANVGHSASTYQTDMTNLIDTLVNTYDATPGSVYVPYPLYDYRPCNPGCGQAVDYLTTYLPVIDTLRETYGMAGGPDLFNTFPNYQATEYFDTVHPNATGYVRMARLWEMAFMKPALAAPIATGRSVALSWDDLAALEPTIVGYNVHYGTSAGNLDQTVVLGDVTSTTIANLLWNTTYYFSVEGFDNDAFVVSYTDDSDTLSTTTDAGSSSFTASAISGNTTEAGGTATFTVVLTGQPTADVTIAVSSSDVTEGTVSPSSLTFTSVDWNTAAAHIVTLTGVDDVIDDGDVVYSVVLAAAVSTDVSYSGVNPADVSATNTDNDSSGFTVSAISGNTTEAGGTATATIVLTAQPTADVIVGLTSSDTTEGTIAPASFTFTSLNWSTPQTVTATGVNDDLDDGDIAYTITTAAATSADGNYNALNPDNISATNTDNDSSGFTVSAISGNTTEAGATATATIVLTAQPTADVSINLTSSDTTEGTIAPASFTFTSLNWSTPQTVTATGVNDDLDDGDVAYTITTAAATSADGNYNTLNPDNISATNTDNDTSGFTVSAISGNTTEAGGTATFTVVLTSQPTEDVVVAVSSSDTTEGTVLPASFTFTAANWSDGAAHTGTVTGVNDDVDDGNIGYSIVLAAAVTGDATYTALNPADVSATNTDNDTFGFTVSTISGNTTEAAATATATIVLTSEPTADVIIGLTSSDTTEGTVSPASFTFTSGNWSTPQTVTATGVNDDLDDGDVAYTITTAAATSADGNYNTLNPDNISATNTDNDTSGFTVSAISGNTTEAAATATATIVLTAQPTADVIVGLTSSDTTEGTIAPASFTFTSLNWSTPQTVTATGVNDDLDDGDIAYTITTAAATSADGNYNTLNPDNISATNTDNDSSGFTVSAISGNTTEAGGTATATIVLIAQPTADVVIGLTSSDTTEGTIAPASFTFTSGNWSTPQTVTATGVNDDLDDGDVAYTITTAAATSADGNYNALNPDNISATNTDNDTIGIVVTESSGTTEVEEDAATDSYTIVLSSEPTADVVVALAFTGEEISLSAATLTFTALNWSDAQTVTVTAVDDNSYESDETVVISHDPSSVDLLYDVLAIASVSVAVESEDATGSNKTPSGSGGGSTTEQTKSINITLPTLDDSYEVGERIAVEWTWVGTISFVNIDLRLSATDSWTSLIANANNSGSASVTLPSEASTSAQVRVQGTDLATTLATATSDVFTITSTTSTDDDTTTPPSSTTDSIDQVAARVDALPTSVSVHGLVKLRNDGDTETQADSAVYYVGADGRRHAFPNDKVYFTWFCDFSGVQIINASDLASIPLGTNVTYRPGTRLVKFITDPKVYAVDQFGILRWMTSEALAVELYGANWASMIDDISDAFFGNYAFGTPIESADDYNQTTEEASVTYPSDTFVIPGYESVPSAGLVCPA